MRHESAKTLAGPDRVPRRALLLALHACLAGTVGAHAQRCDLAWSHFGIANGAPSDRVLPGMAADVDARRIVLFGGGFSSLHFTWVWFGSACHQYSGGSATPRYAHTMAYDGANHRTVMFGGLLV